MGGLSSIACDAKVRGQWLLQDGGFERISSAESDERSQCLSRKRMLVIGSTMYNYI